jgi:hypothetical protein
MDEEERAAANPQIEQDQKHDRSFDGCDLHVDGLRWHIEISHEENYVTDNALFRFHRWLANLRILEVDEIKAIPGTPRSHAFVERLIGTVRREYLDRTLFWNQGDLEGSSGTTKPITTNTGVTPS